MNRNYSCKICDEYCTDRIYELIRHLLRKKQCMKSIKSYDYSNDQLIILSLIPNKEINYLKIKINQIDKNIDLISKNKSEILDIIKLIDKQKIKKCSLCNCEFTKISELKEHLLLDCFYKSKKVSDNIQINNMIDSNNTVNNMNNNNITNNNITNNIYLNIKNPIPFDEKWNISNIDNLEKIIFSKIMYTNLLTEILKNEINLNVIIDKDNDSGIIYKNDIDKYIKIKSEDIIDKTMIKLKEQLLCINNNSEEYFLKDCLNISKSNIEKKYEDYIVNCNEV